MAQLARRPDIKHVAAAVKDALDKIFGWAGPKLLNIRGEAAVLLAGAVQVNPYLWNLPITQGLADELVSALTEVRECLFQWQEGMPPILTVKLACKIIKGRQKEAERLARLNS